MRLYIVLDKKSNIKYAITSKRWLARLFYIQRYKINTNLIITHQKSKLSKSDLQYHDLALHYFSGFALLPDELDYIDTNLIDSGIAYYREKYHKKVHKRALEAMESIIINDSIKACIYRKSEVLDKIHCIKEWKRKVGDLQ